MSTITDKGSRLTAQLSAILEKLPEAKATLDLVGFSRTWSDSVGLGWILIFLNLVCIRSDLVGFGRIQSNLVGF